MRADDVARYLQDHPQFFEDYHDLLAQLYVPHPHGGRTISITERQILTLRERAKALELKLAELLRFGEDNDLISGRVHALSIALLTAGSFDSVMTALREQLAEAFAIPHLALRLWNSVLTRDNEVFAPVEEGIRVFANESKQPYCGPVNDLGVLAWFGDVAPSVQSMALIPLRRDSRTVGLLALGATDETRFVPDMGTLYLERIGELLGASLIRELG
ncbi:MAG: DUF484 family protein [Gammaproteobacteria bacterium]|jgi:uncharacterized protein|nr:DUF484 family protein [Gammaproteobacteria bacterium]MBU0772577.1 DUF484 family protein [Gammaproteobacteria bacterium]MBU0858252.1 DUF484 family protein [Gammaproteobacteria bacterium]MBU1846506.1 DUF484 family protein [Gammaproteobacteria bacterium]